MIKTENGATEVKGKTAEELFRDMLNIITTFITYSLSIGVPEETIERILMEMVVDGFKDSNVAKLIDLSGKEDGNDN